MFQRQALYLGELNDSQRAEWQKAVEAFDEDGRPRQLKLFPEDRAPESDDGSVVRIRMDRLSVKNMRNWGEVWLGTVLWDKLGLDGFWSKKLPPSRKGTDWLAIMKVIVLYRFTAPGSELEMHSNWMANTAVEELISLRPVYHQLDDRIEAHIFASFMALCLFQTLRAIAREHASDSRRHWLKTTFRKIKVAKTGYNISGRATHPHYPMG